MFCTREVQEEMGLEFAMSFERRLGTIRYGFTIPDGSPRLKQLHMYLLRCEERVTGFAPREQEGVVEVKWFHPAEAIRVVSHRSLKPLMRRTCRNLQRDYRRK